VFAVLAAVRLQVNQKMMRMVLRKLGYEADVASNGLEVLQAVRERAAAEAYDCILMDVNMPEMDGLEATAALRADASLPAACQPYIIALTANVMQQDRDRCRQAGMQDFLSKPITLEPLTLALKTAFRARQTD
jgi:CheY-like chemotaxis protein